LESLVTWGGAGLNLLERYRSQSRLAKRNDRQSSRSRWPRGPLQPSERRRNDQRLPVPSPMNHASHLKDFFLLQRASLPIDSGVIGFAPGTKVTLVEEADSVSTVTDGEYQFKVPASQLTNDLDVAASVAKEDYAKQAQIAELTAKRAQQYSQQERDAFIASEKEKAQKKTGKKTPRRPSPTPRR
jgi:hypothetical protein